MPDTTTPLPLTRSRAEQIFPVLTPAQIGRIAAIGRMHAISSGEVLVEQGDSAIPFFVVVSGELEAVRPTSAAETLITVFRAGYFTGEVNTLLYSVAEFKSKVAAGNHNGARISRAVRSICGRCPSSECSLTRHADQL